MKIYLKGNGTKDNWVDFDIDGNSFKLLIDYPTPAQEQHLQSILFGYNYIGEDKMVKLSQFGIKYTVKGWEGITDMDNHIVDIKIVNNEMEENQWWAFVRDTAFAIKVFSEINKKIRLTETDKKKYSTVPPLTMTDILEENEETTQ